ncbi:MAG: T9SS type A sorting domain-containing protein [bacterium]|nr:T9SS type A sorting domain-containing protein [bacterium]
MRVVAFRSSASTLVLTALIIALLPVASLAANVLHEGTFEIRDLTWEVLADGSTRPVLEGTRSVALPGETDLPVRELTLLVPLDRRIVSVEIEALAVHRFGAPDALATAVAEVSSEGPINVASLAATDPAAGWGGMTGAHVWRGYRLLTVQVRPVRKAAGGELEFLDAYAVNVEFGGPMGDDVAQRRRFMPRELERNTGILAEVVDNADVLSAYDRKSGTVVAAPGDGFQPTPVPSLEGSAVNHLIVTSAALAPEFQRLADYRASLGMPSVVVTREFIEANYRQGVDVQESIRLFIRDAYEMWGTEYVLLAGDSEVLPPRIVNNSLYPLGGSTDIPVDLYFACLDGNWNANGNHRFGETAVTGMASDDADFAEEVYVGRAPVATLATAAIFVDKVITYEGTAAGQQWPNRSLYAAEVLFPDPYTGTETIQLDGSIYADQQITDHILPCTTRESWAMYEDFRSVIGDAILTRSALIDTLNGGGYGIVNQIGHGFYFNMSVGDANFTNGDADALTNGDALFMLYALNCSSAGFHYSCLMERFLQNPDGGAVASIGSVEAAFPVTANMYQQEFFDLLYCQDEYRIGRTLALSRLPFLVNTGSNYTDRWTFLNYTLLGDPALALWTSSPRGLIVSAPTALALGDQSVAITVSDSSGVVEGAIVCLAKDGEDYATGVTDAGGQVILGFRPVAGGDAVLTISGLNLERTTSTIPVTVGTTYLAVESMVVHDSGTLGSAGNGNGEIEAGETIALVPTLRETGGAPATGIFASMTITVPGVTILDGAVSFPDVAAGGTTVAATAFRFEVAPDVADGTELPVLFNVGAGGGPYPSTWDARILAPEMEITAVDWSDSAFGNDDGVLDPGERVEVTFDVRNFGAGRANLLNAYLRSDDGNVVLYDTLASLPALDLMGDAAGSVPFSMGLVDAALVSHGRIVLEDDYGRTTVQDIYLQRPATTDSLWADTTLGPDLLGISWTPSASGDVVGYNVYRSANEAGPFVQANRDLVTGTTYYRDVDLDLLTQYFYRIVAVDEALVPSGLSTSVMVSTAPAEATNFPIDFGLETSGHLALGDVDGDGWDEIILGADGIYVWNHDGTENFDGDGNSQTLGPITALDSQYEPGGVALAQIDGEKGLDIVVSSRGEGYNHVNVFRWDGTQAPGWPKSTRGLPGADWNWATPAVGDIDGDGDNEVVVITLNGRVWAWHHDGVEVRDGDSDPATDGVFHTRAGSDFEWDLAGPALADLDGDGAREIIFGTRNDSSGNRYMYVVRYDGTDLPGFPYLSNGPIVCHPAIADLEGDGTKEIVFYTTFNQVCVIRQDGSDYPGFPTTVGATFSIGFVTSPGLGDVDGDGELEILIAANTAGSMEGKESRLLIVDTDIAGGTSGDVMSGWPVYLPGSSEASPLLADINGDGELDVVHGIGGGSTTSPNNLYAFNWQGVPIAGFPITLRGPIAASPVVADPDRDHDVDIILGSRDRQLHVWDMPFAYDVTDCPWATFQSDRARTGEFLDFTVVAVGDDSVVPPAGFTVGSAYPNPFNPSTKVRLYMPERGDLRLRVYDLQGRVVRNLYSGQIDAGWHTMVWDGRDEGGRAQASGLYFMKAASNREVSVQKMTLVK